MIDWKFFAAWLDTEGNISSLITRMKRNKIGWARVHRLEISQKEREPLEKLKVFLLEQGISRVDIIPASGTRRAWALRIHRVRDIEKVTSEAEPYIITQNKRKQIERFRKFRTEVRKPITPPV